MSQAPTTGFFGHPVGLRTLFLTEMWERFSYYGLRPLPVLFMSAALLDGGFGFDRSQASAIGGIYAGCGYLAAGHVLRHHVSRHLDAIFGPLAMLVHLAGLADEA